MARSLMWMSNGPLGVWIPCPNSPFEAENNGASEKTELLNGGSFVKRSWGSSRTFHPAWNGNVTDLQPIEDVYNGLYGTGPFYFIDPSNVNNMLPPHWAAPQLSGNDRWPTLMKGVNPTYAATTVSSTYTPPPQMATYTYPTAAPVFSTTTPRILLPIPPNWTLNLRVWGAFTGTAVVRVNRYNRSTGALTTVDLAPTSTGALVTVAGATYSHVEVWLTKISTAASTITLASLLANVSLVSSAPTAWTPGEGHSGVQFSGELGRSIYRSMGLGWRSYQATLEEVGSWQR